MTLVAYKVELLIFCPLFLQALMTGSIPNYIDVALNLGSNQVIEDNLIHQATENDLNIVFYGDEVWLTLFPDKFMRMEGTMSFFVSDFTEVLKSLICVPEHLY